MKSPLAFFRSYQDQDYNLRGMVQNWETGIFRWPEQQMFSCWTPVFKSAHPYPVLTSVALCRIDIHSGTRRELSRTAASLTLFSLENVATGQARWRSNLSSSLGIQKPGTYDFQLTDSWGNTFVSNPFYLCQPFSGYAPVISFFTNSPGFDGCCDINTADSVQGYGTIQDPIKLKGDETSPAASNYYGTDSSGARGYHSLPVGYENWVVSSGESEYPIENLDRLNIETAGTVDVELTQPSAGVVNLRIDGGNGRDIKARKIAIIGL